jgi:hypothetical protein
MVTLKAGGGAIHAIGVFMSVVFMFAYPTRLLSVKSAIEFVHHLRHEFFFRRRRPIRLDVRSSSGRRMLFIVAGGQKLEEGIPAEYHAATGVFGLIVLTPRGAHLGAVATNNLYEGFETYGRYPRPSQLPFAGLDQTGHTAG